MRTLTDKRELFCQLIFKGADQGKLSWDDYQPVDVGLGKPRWARIEDVRKYQIKQWQQP